MPSQLVRLFGSLLRALTGRDEELPSRIERSTGGRESTTPSQSNDLELQQVLENNLGSDRLLVAGTIQLVSMGGIKEELGSAWPDLSDRARHIAEQEIRKDLSPHYVYRPVGDDTFVLCFADADRSKAEATSAILSERIRARLRNEMPELQGRIGVDEFMTEVDSRSILGGDLPVGDALFAALMKVRAEADRAATKYQSEYLQDVRIIFQPVWDVAGARSSFNRCLLGPLSSENVFAHLESITDRHELADAVAQLDCLLLTRGLESLHRALQSQTAKPSIIIPVQFATLGNGDAAARYFRLLQLLPPQYRGFAGLEVQCLPALADPLELLDAIELVKPHVATVLLKLPPEDIRIGAAMKSVLWGLSLDLGGWGDNGGDVRNFMLDFVKKARGKGLRTLAYGANTFGLAQAARDAGFDLIGGSAIHLNADAPKPPAPLNPQLAISEMDLAEHHWRHRATDSPA